MELKCEIKQTYGKALSKTTIYYQKPGGGTYTAVEMNKAGPEIYSGIIPANAISVEGLEYFIYSKDVEGNVAIYPEKISPSSVSIYDNGQAGYLGPDAQGLIVHAAKDGGVIIQSDNLTDNDAVYIKIYSPNGDTFDIDFCSADKDWNKGFTDISKRVATIAKETVAIDWNGGSKRPGNYLYLIKDLYGKELDRGRFTVLDAVYAVSLNKTSNNGYDNISATVADGSSSDNVGIYQNNYYGYYAAQRSGGSYVSSVPQKSGSNYLAGVYESGKDYFVGLSGYSPPYPDGPIIKHSPDIVSQTWKHPLKVSCQVKGRQNRMIGAVTLWYTKSNGNIFYSTTTIKSAEAGDGFIIYSGNIPKQLSAGKVKYYFEAEDSVINRAWKPAYPGAERNFSLNIIEDNTPPKVDSVYPADGVIDLQLNLTAELKFSESLAQETLAITVKNPQGNIIPIFSINYDDVNFTLAFELKKLKPETKYQCEINVTDMSENALFYSWSFTTKKVQPPAITGLSNALANFNLSASSQTLSFKVSRPVGEVKFIFKNTATQEEYTFTDSRESAKGTFSAESYSLNWDGKIDGGEELPAGEYIYRIEATDIEFGIEGASDIQPYTLLVKGNGTVTYEHKIEYKNNEAEKGQPNFAQSITFDYHYNRDFSGGNMIANLGDRTDELGTNWDSAHGGAGGEQHGVNANANVYVEGGTNKDEASFAFLRRYADPDSIIYNWCEEKNGVRAEYNNYYAKDQIINQLESTTTLITINLHPNNDDVLWPSKPTNRFATNWVKLENAHIIEAVTGQDYDDNPEVETKVSDWWVYDPDPKKTVIKGYLSAKNISLPVQPFIFDRQAPWIAMFGKKFDFSSRLGQECDLSFTVTDNLAYLLNQVSLKIYDAKGVLVKTLYEQTADGQATHTLVWEGTGSAAYNNGELVKDGKYLAKMIAVDKVGNQAQLVQEIILDNTPPEVSIPVLTIIPKIPPNPPPPLPKGEEKVVFTNQDAQLKIDYTLTDNYSKVIDVLIRFEGAANFVRQGKYDLTVGGEQTIRPYLWDGKDDQGNFAPDGDYSITIEASDEVGNKAISVSSQFIIDRMPSLVTSAYVDNLIFTPDDGVNNTGDGYQDTVTLHYVLAETADVELCLEDVLGRKVLTGPTIVKQISGSWLWDGKIDGKYASDGTYKFRIKTIDAHGNIAYGTVAVIKNQVPAEIIFPAGEKVTGIVNIKGIALDPGISNPNDFKWYKLYYREGGGLDFNLAENNPLF
ncbi:MAG: FlgD immunoglobulin-like domain containing protein [Elusimicrobiota bacterium]